MKKMLILRGLPGSGKSTFVKENHLSDMTISSDDLRNMFGGYTLGLSEDKFYLQINQSNDKQVWDTFYKILEHRLKNADTVVLDTTCVTKEMLNTYLSYAARYFYDVTIADFMVPLDTALSRNAERPLTRRVPENVIRKMNKNLEEARSMPLPDHITISTPEGALKLPLHVRYLPIEGIKKDMHPRDIFGQIPLLTPFEILTDDYKKVNHIGDIHGCFSALQKALPEIKDDEFYIFHGDYLDRGMENAQCLKYMMDISKRSNVVLLEGNHESHLRDYAVSGKAPEKAVEFNEYTVKQLQKAGITRQQIIDFYDKLHLAAIYLFNDKEVIATHGGISFEPLASSTFYLLSGKVFIKGTGSYENMEQICQSFAKKSISRTYQVFGHRNNHLIDSHVHDKSYCLCDDTEYGGYLRTLTLDEEGFHEQYTKNDVHKLSHDTLPVRDLVSSLRSNPYIREKQFDGGISSFNFTREAFFSGIWNEQTMIARGLYINTRSNRIVARGYDKFFAIGEREETSFESLQDNLHFPVKASIKYNGFLGLVGCDVSSDRLIITSKSDLTGDYAKNFEKILLGNPDRKNKLIDLLKDGRHTLAFECIDPIGDPHIIKEQTPHVMLLDMIRNKVTFQKEDYKTLKAVARDLDVPVREQAYVIKDMEQLRSFTYKTSRQDYRYKGEEIEGYVLEDASGSMLKVKTGYYNFWKKNRSLLRRVLSGKELDLSGIDETQKDFAMFCKEFFEKGELVPGMDIISVRDMYLSMKEKQSDTYDEPEEIDL